MAKRVSLTKKQQEEQAGAELLALCQSITEDGSLSQEELGELGRWLNRNKDSDLPAVEFLFDTIRRIIADGKITPEEHHEIHLAIEKVLPPEVRKTAAQKRKAIERAEREKERELTRPVASANFMVAGVHYEGRSEIVARCVTPGDQVSLVRDPENPHSRNAIQVVLQNGLQIGFVPEDDAKYLAPYLDQGCPQEAHTTKVLTGGRAPIPVVQVYLYRPDTSKPPVVHRPLARQPTASQPTAPQQTTPIISAKRHTPTARRQKGCLVLAAVALLAGLFGWIVESMLT